MLLVNQYSTTIPSNINDTIYLKPRSHWIESKNNENEKV